MTIITTDLKILDSAGQPANGIIYWNQSARYNSPAGVVTTTRGKARVIAGVLTAPDGQQFDIPQTPEDQVVTIVEDFGSGVVTWVTQIPAGPQVDYSALSQVVPPSTGGGLPSWVADILAVPAVAEAAADAATAAAAAAQTARDQAAAFAGTNNAQVAGFVATDGPTKTALSATIGTETAGKLDKTEAATTYSPKASPAFTGVPTVNGQQIAPAATPYPYWRKKLAQVRAGISDAKLLCLGDSTTYGYVAPPNNVATPAIASYPSDLAAILNNYFAPSAVGIGIPKAQTGTSVDGRWTVGSGWTYTPGSSIGWAGTEMYLGTASSGALVYSPGTSAGTVDTFDVYYVASGSTPEFTIQATGGTPVTVTPGSQNGVFKATCTAATAATTNSVSITTTATAGSRRITGVEAYHSTVRRIRVGNVGVGGSSSTGWAADTNAYSAIDHIATYAPDLTIIDLGLNDMATAITAESFKTKMTAITAAARLSGDVIFMVPPPPDLSGGLAAGYARLIPTYAELAATLQTGLVDINSRWISRDYLNPLGYYSDTLHPSRIGYGDIAQAVSTLIRAI